MINLRPYTVGKDSEIIASIKFTLAEIFELLHRVNMSDCVFEEQYKRMHGIDMSVQRATAPVYKNKKYQDGTKLYNKIKLAADNYKKKIYNSPGVFDHD